MWLIDLSVQDRLSFSRASSPLNRSAIAPIRRSGTGVYARGTLALMRRTLAGVPFALFIGLAIAGFAAGQEHERASDWGTDNLDLVSASATEIRDVLAKDPGLMVELKRLMAKRATDRGQIVEERDLDDSTIQNRLETDPRFRALATRLLQRYGYLTPQLNPKSPAGQEQDLVLKARAERLARTTTDLGPAFASSEAVCGPGQDDRRCSTEASQSPRNLLPESGSSQTACDPEQQNAHCPAQPNERPLSPNPAAPEERAPGSPVPNQENPDLTAQSLLTVSAASPNDMAQSESRPGARSSEDLNDGLGMGNSLYPQPQYSESQLRSLRSGENPDLTGRMQGGASASRDRQSPRTVATRGELKVPVLPEQVEMVNSPSPYAYIPALYDLYVQAAPRSGSLERFGLEVFRRPPESTGIPMDLPAGPDYVLGPGDELIIDLWGGVAQRLFRTVDREGRLALPEAGPLPVSGKTLGEVQDVAQRILRTQYRDVSADISLGRLRTVRVYVVGDVASPGAYDISSLSTPLNALWAAGGVTSRGSLRLLRHSRGQQVVEQVDVYDLLLKGVRGDLQNLENGDTLLVPPVGAQVTVDGMVRRPAIYELRGETDLAQVLDLAGGVLPAAALRHIEVQRLDAHQKRTMFSVNLDDTSDPQAVHRQLAVFTVRDGDEIHIYPIAPYNSAEVYLQGRALRPGRYAYTSGMRVADLVTSYHDLLPEPANHYAEIIRLRQPDWRPVVESFDLAAALANPSTSPKLEPLDTVRIFGRYDVEAAPVFWLSGEVRDPGQYRTSGQMHLRDAIYQAGGLLPDARLDSVQLFRNQPDGSLRILDVNLASALNADPLENVLIEPRDRIIVHRSMFRVDPASVTITGEVANPGRYPLADNMRLENLLGAAGGPKRSADLKSADLTRYSTGSGSLVKSEHERVDLTEVGGDPNRNLSLRDGDVLSIPQISGWNDLGASVTIKGEVKNPGVYGIHPGERLSSVLKRAGRFLPTAFPQGIVFTRFSVRELQEKSKQDLIQRIDQESAVVKTSLTASGTEEVALQQEAMQQRERVLEALRRAPVTGRLVIRLQPGLKGFEHSSQDLELRNGDMLEVPKQPGFVLVVGQVYNGNAITYTPGKNAGWYLAQGGGATHLADKGAIFIIRADGEVISRHGGGLWSGNILSVQVRPGDTIMVPERPVLGSTRWKNIIALAQVAEAGAITAAIVP
jgi:polysaccharide biosynthesis/export protein